MNIINRVLLKKYKLYLTVFYVLKIYLQLIHFKLVIINN